MSGAGHIIDMNNRMRQNRSMKSSKRQKFQGSNRALDFAMKNTTEVCFKEVPKAELDAIKNTILTKVKSVQKRESIIFISVIVITIMTSIYFYAKYAN